MSVAKKDYIDQLDALLEQPTPGGEALAPAKFGVLVSLTNDDLGATTISVADALRGRGATPSLLYVIEINSSVPDSAIVICSLEDGLRDPATQPRQIAEMRSALRLDNSPAKSWPFAMAVGEVARVVVEQARLGGSELIVMGLNRHGTTGRLLGRDTVRGVMSLGGVPVLAVRPELTGLPKRVVVPMDFSRASIRAAHLARRIIGENGLMTLLFVESRSSGKKQESDEGLELIHSRGLAAVFEQVVASLRPSAGVSIDTVIRTGEPAPEIARFCDEYGADLVAVGSQSHRFLDRLLLGSVAKAIAGDGRWSVLVTPPEKSVQP